MKAKMTKLFFAFLSLMSNPLDINAQQNERITLSGQSFEYRLDSLKSKLNCSPNKQNKFWNFGNILVSSEYTLIDSISINTYNKLFRGYVLILSPKIQEEDKYKLQCYNNQANKRLIVFIEKINNKYYVENIGENLILNRGEYPSEPYKNIVKVKNGVKIQFNIGSSKKCNYEFTFSNVANSFYLSKSTRECYLINLSRKSNENIKIKLNDQNYISKIDIRKFIDFPNFGK